MLNVSLNAHTCWPECTFGVSAMVVLRLMVDFGSIFACLQCVGSHMPLAMCTASSVLQLHRVQNHLNDSATLMLTQVRRGGDSDEEKNHYL